MATNISNGRKIDQMFIKYTNIFHCKTFQNLPKLEFLVWNTNHLATLFWSWFWESPFSAKTFSATAQS
jgi:hypothetical protein